MSDRRSVLGGMRVASYGADDLVIVDDLDGGEGIVVVTINAAERHNVLDPPMMRALAEAFDDVTARRDPDPNADEVRAVILRAEGRSFSVGLDIGNLGDYFETGFGRDANPFAAITECPFPVIGAVNGAAVTGGFEVALSCDMLVATPHALFMDNHTKYGLHPVAGLTWRLAKSVGVNNAKLATLASYPIDGRTALAWGLVQRLADDADALDREALEIARLIAANHPVAVKVSKQIHEANLLGRRPGPEIEQESDAGFYDLLTDVEATVQDGAEKFNALVRWVADRDLTGPTGSRTSA
jgi:enoyl-CoA hydratase